MKSSQCINALAVIIIAIICAVLVRALPEWVDTNAERGALAKKLSDCIFGCNGSIIPILRTYCLKQFRGGFLTCYDGCWPTIKPEVDALALDDFDDFISESFQFQTQW